jgi:hypothetical protein
VSEEESKKSEEDRREYFRIDDQVLLNLRPLEESAMAEVAERIHGRVPDRFTVAANFAVNSRAMARLLHGFSANSPDAARYMKLMDQKLNQLARLFVAEEVGSGEYPRLNVNLSAGGVVFPARQEFTKGQLLETRMVLYPNMTGILTISRVVYCERLANLPGDVPWQVAVEYVHIRESDRDLLCSHIMNRETELLRDQRSTEE